MSTFLGGLLQRVEASWGLNHPGEHSRLVEVEVPRFLTEVVPAGSVQTHDLAASELDLVQVRCEEFLFPNRSIEGASVPDLGAFAFQLTEHVTPLKVMENQVLEQLHWDGAAAPAEPTSQYRCECNEVHAVMIHVPPVLDGDDRLLHSLG